MNYMEKTVYDTISDIKKRLIGREIKDESNFQALCDYLEKHSVDQFYKELKGDVLPTEVKIQYEKICEIVDEINY